MLNGLVINYYCVTDVEIKKGRKENIMLLGIVGRLHNATKDGEVGGLLCLDGIRIHIKGFDP